MPRQYALINGIAHWTHSDDLRLDAAGASDAIVQCYAPPQPDAISMMDVETDVAMRAGAAIESCESTKNGACVACRAIPACVPITSSARRERQLRCDVAYAAMHSAHSAVALTNAHRRLCEAMVERDRAVRRLLNRLLLYVAALTIVTTGLYAVWILATRRR